MDQTQITFKPWTTIICGLLLLSFAVVSYSAVLTKNATIDEPSHAMSGWLAIRHGDFRLDTVNPSLWKFWAAIGNCRVDLKLLPDPEIWKDLTWSPAAEVPWSARMLYSTPGVNGDAFVNRSRAMMLLLGIGLGGLIARWSYRIAGPVAAIVATTVFCFDPNFIAQAPMVKSDVAFALALLGLAYSVWQLGKKATLGWMIATGMICATAGTIKYSGVIVGPILAIMLFIRAMMPQPWELIGRSLTSRFARLLAAITISLFAAVCCFAVAWASYGFRFRPAPSPTVQMDMSAIYKRARLVETTVDLLHVPSQNELAAHAPSEVLQFVRWANRVHLLPQAMLAGFLYQHTCVQTWPAFLNGELYGDGRWYYFPLATLYKTPVCELIAYCEMLVVLFYAMRKYRNNLWEIICLVIPFSIFAIATLTTHLNIGLRNALPLFPFVQIAAGCAAAICWQHRPRTAGKILSILAIGLVCETICAWPDYIAFFNFPSGGELGGVALLGDSNLDWGQDIVNLARWQRAHPNVELYAKLFRSVDPGFYGLKYHEISVSRDGPHAGEPEFDAPLQPGVIAVSATQLQGLYLKPWELNFYARLRAAHPIAVINGTIYIYQFNPSG